MDFGSSYSCETCFGLRCVGTRGPAQEGVRKNILKAELDKEQLLINCQQKKLSGDGILACHAMLCRLYRLDVLAHTWDVWR